MRPFTRGVGLLALAFCVGCGQLEPPASSGGGESGGEAGEPSLTGAAGAAGPASDGSAGTGTPDVDASTLNTDAGAADTVEASPPAPLTLDELVPPPAMAGEDFTLALAAHGGTPPFSWSVTTGALPGGLMLNGADDRSAMLSGKPLHSGTGAFTVQVADGAGAVAGRALTLVVRGRPWAIFNTQGGLHQVDLARDDATPLPLGGFPARQPGGSLDALRVGADGSIQGIDLGGAAPTTVPLAAPPLEAKGFIGSFRWSRDGKRLAFTDDEDLFVVDATAAPGVPLRANGARAAGDKVSSFVWAGASLVYSVWNQDRGYWAYLVSVDPPGTPMLLAKGTSGLGWSPSPDQTRLIYAVNEPDPVLGSSRYVAYLLGVDGHSPASPRRLDGDLFSTDGYSPTFSWTNDSKAIEYAGVGPGGNAARYRLNLDDASGIPRLRFEGPCQGGTFAMSPDERWLAFTGCGLWLVDLGGGGPVTFRQLVPAPGEDSFIGNVGWTANGRRLLYLNGEGLNAIDTTGAVPGAPVNLSAGLPSGYKKWLFAPDGSKLAVRVVRGPRQEVYLIPFAGPTPKPPVKMSAAAADGAYQYTPDHAGAWSADGTRFVYEALVGPAFKVFAVNVDGDVPSNARLISGDQPVVCCQSPSIIQR